MPECRSRNDADSVQRCPHHKFEGRARICLIVPRHPVKQEALEAGGNRRGSGRWIVRAQSGQRDHNHRLQCLAPCERASPQRGVVTALHEENQPGSGGDAIDAISSLVVVPPRIVRGARVVTAEGLGPQHLLEGDGGSVKATATHAGRATNRPKRYASPSITPTSEQRSPKQDCLQGRRMTPGMMTGRDSRARRPCSFDLIIKRTAAVEVDEAFVAPDMRQIGYQITLATAYRRPPLNRVARLVGAGLSGEAGRPIYVLGNLCSIP
jgi:hypothetical protein